MSDPQPIIIATDEYSDAAIERLRAGGAVEIAPTTDRAALLSKLPASHALLVRTATVVDAGMIEAAKHLRVIGRAGVGVDNIDIAAARARGIVVVHTPAAATTAVAELTVGLMLSLIRQIPAADLAARAPERFKEFRAIAAGPELAQLSLGIVGLGRIGQAVGSRAAALGMNVLYHDIREVSPTGFSASAVSLDELLARSDVVSLHVPLTGRTRRMIDGAAITNMKPGALLINTARGAVCDSDALAEALSWGKLGGAALDVTDPEPLSPGHPLLSAPNTIFTPHIGARTPAALRAMEEVVDDVLRVLAGESPRWPVSPEAAR